MSFWKRLVKSFNQPFETDDTMSPYYVKKAGVWNRVRFLALLLLIVLVLEFLLTNIRLLSYENLYHFIRDMGTSVAAAQESADTLQYVTDENQSAALYRNGLCVVGNKHFTLFSVSGRQLLTDSLNLSRPMVCASDKLVVAYDLGGTSVCAYNSSGKLWDLETDFPIEYLTVSESGTVAVVTTGDTNLNFVYLYDIECNPVARIRKNSYVFSVVFNEKSDRIALFELNSNMGNFVLHVEQYKFGRALSQTPDYGMDFYGVFPYYTGYSQAGQLMILCDTKLLYLNEKGKIVAEKDFPYPVKSASMRPEGCALCFQSNSMGSSVLLWVFDARGKSVFEKPVRAEAEQIVLQGKQVWLKGDTLSRLSLKNGDVQTAQTVCTGKMLLVGSDGKLLLYQKAVTEIIAFEN